MLLVGPHLQRKIHHIYIVDKSIAQIVDKVYMKIGV